jgi:hypothetical protein
MTSYWAASAGRLNPSFVDVIKLKNPALPSGEAGFFENRALS